jgi:hypothetical protein
MEFIGKLIGDPHLAAPATRQNQCELSPGNRISSQNSQIIILLMICLNNLNMLTFPQHHDRFAIKNMRWKRIMSALLMTKSRFKIILDVGDKSQLFDRIVQEIRKSVRRVFIQFISTSDDENRCLSALQRCAEQFSFRISKEEETTSREICTTDEESRMTSRSIV